MRTLSVALSSIFITLIAFIVGPFGLLIAPADAANKCARVMVIVVPGTTETNPGANPNVPAGLLKEVVEPVRKAARPTLVRAAYIPYPADIIGESQTLGYGASRRTGIDNATNTMTEISKKCPQARFIITGYSQGAHVAGDLGALIGANQSPVGADKVLGIALLADPAQAPEGEPTLGVTGPAVGFAGARPGGFGSLTDRVISICAPNDLYCNAPTQSPTLRLIGLLGSQIDSNNPNGIGDILGVFATAFLAPITEAVGGVLNLITQPNFVANLVTGAQLFAAQLSQQAGIAGPVLQGVGTVIASVEGIIAAVASRSWAQIPGLVSTAVTTANDMVASINATAPAISQHAPGGVWLAAGNVFGQLQQAGFDDRREIPDRSKDLFAAFSAATNALMAAVPVAQFPALGPFYAQFTPQQVTTDLLAFARFLQGGAHTSYDTTVLDDGGHTGTQLMSRWMLTQIQRLR